MNSHQRCSHFLAPCSPNSVLFVGAERADEFANALEMVYRGHDVTVVNPRRTSNSSAFQGQSGRFVPLKIEQLPYSSGRFDTICENYPYPLRRYSGPAKRFAMARLQRLASGGRWIVFTESPRFATALKALTDFDDDVARDFTLKSSIVSPRNAPPSSYPPVDTRFRLIFQRRG